MAQKNKTRKYEVTYHVRGKPRPVITEIVEATCEAGARVAIRVDHHLKGQGVKFIGTPTVVESIA